ncbi:uncharacterized protein LOC123219680 [Mangifera indica]|uniref:uncharacterized protein LOC123219680 n=1 Tax=Mangifera indica TaxID=29780 RepID=UPI001CF97DC0|nr:uncharacterized protein LOC123219680 [Mangifera indica]
MYGIPLKLWTPKGLNYIASAIGNPLYVDSITKEGTRLDYTRICIEIKLDAECPDSICLSLPNGECMVINVEYSWKPLKCNGCQCFGHSTANYTLATKLGDDSTSRKILKDGVGIVLPRKPNGKDKMVQEAKGYDKKTKAIKESQELDKVSILLNKEEKHENTTSVAKTEGKKYVSEASISKETRLSTAASESVRENDETSINTIKT